ncbi:hypothetical protein GH714_033425 [Hevea brasiliensis]|uniref:RING-type E3 ubiquitin transferase n=1 Tax=Hevea brasiliensis TaxID=3981 RepID=A0A6A6L6E2_HEVBR|nr:hypothetical protein GH714_033425 [Hevea brasiliensis]
MALKEEDPKSKMMGRLIDSVKEICGLPECKNICRKMHGNLIRRIKLLSPLFEELRDSNEELGEEAINGFELLRIALDSAMGLLKSANEGSKLYQTYERLCIQKWLDAGHKTCPKTQQTLSHTALTPNYVLKSLIALWCENNEKLANGNLEQQRAAAGELRLLAKRNADNRVCIAEAGAIPLLVELLCSTDPRTQEHAVTALLNLSINDSNKGTIVKVGAIPDIVDVLRNGSMEARENAAATLFSLSVIDENKGNKARAVRAGIVPPLMQLLKDAGGGMVDEALAILAILASHQEGKVAIGQAEPIPVLMEVIRTGSPRNRENAAAVLWSLCAGDSQQLKLAKECGAEEALKELSDNGTDRAKRKAGSLLELIQRDDGVVNQSCL